MTEPLPPTQTTGETLAYRPISGWAIAGFAIGSLFGLLVVISTAVAMVQGAPMFFPVWILGLAILGIVLSLIGQSQVQSSEGTRAGATLARLGLWFSLVSGLGYLSYYYVTGLAVQSQANTFLMDKGEDSGFFPRLREGATKPSEINAAFLLTLPSTMRSGRPDDELGLIQLHDTPSKDGAPGNLTQFREGYFPRIFFKHLAKDAEITPLGVQDWRYEVRSYKIYRNYHVKTKELEVDLQMAVFSSEESAGQQRKWYVNARESGPVFSTLTLTPVGEGVKYLRGHAHAWLMRWAAALNDGQAFPDIKRKDQSEWKQVYVKDGDRDKIRAVLHQALASSDRNRIKGFNVLVGAKDVGKWEPVDGKIRIYHNVRFSLDKEPGGPPFFTVDGHMVLETKQPLDPAQFGFNSPPPEWDIIRMVIHQVTTPSPLERKKG